MRADARASCWRAPASMSSCWRSTPTSCATSAATPSTLRRWNSWASSACSMSFCKLPHEKALTIGAFFGDREYAFADFTPSADALQVRRTHAAVGFPQFPRRARQDAIPPSICACARKRSISSRRTAASPGCAPHAAMGAMEVRADLTVGCDGRHSTVRARAGLTGRGSRRADGRALVSALRKKPATPRRPWADSRPAHIVDSDQPRRLLAVCLRDPEGRHGGNAPRRPCRHFVSAVARRVPMLADRVDELKDWDQIKLLTVAVDRLVAGIGRGSSALAMPRMPCPRSAAWASIWRCRTRSPQRIFSGSRLRAERCETRDLARVQKRRMFPDPRHPAHADHHSEQRDRPRRSRENKPLQAPLVLRLMSLFALLRRIPARLVGLGVRPEHVHTPERSASAGG